MAGGGMDIKVKGADTLARTAHAAAKDLADLSEVNREVADTWAAAARGVAPRRSGRLAASTTAQATKNTAEVGSALIYAGPIHSGWRAHNISPNPWIERTLDTRQGQVINTYEQDVTDIVNQIRGA